MGKLRERIMEFKNKNPKEFAERMQNLREKHPEIYKRIMEKRSQSENKNSPRGEQNEYNKQIPPHSGGDKNNEQGRQTPSPADKGKRR